MAGEPENTHQVQDLRRELHGLARAERELRDQIGARILAGDPVVDLRAIRRELRESQEDISAAVQQLEAATP